MYLVISGFDGSFSRGDLFFVILKFKSKRNIRHDGTNKITILLEYKPCFKKVFECGSKLRNKNMTSHTYIKTY